MTPPISDTVQALIGHYQMQPHPEGGYYVQTYRSPEMLHEECLPIRFPGQRCFSTAILFLLPGSEFSAFHRLKSDELWHFHSGSPLNIYVISPEGGFSLITLGPRFDQGHEFQAVVRAGHWFASAPSDPYGFSFVGCTVSPGFDFEDFEMAMAESLTAEYPQHEELIRRFCH
jgi:hypothetical protein